MMKNKQEELFRIVEYSADAAERIGYSNYSYWRSVFRSFLKKKFAVFMSFVFVGLVIFSYIAQYIGHFQYTDLVIDTNLAFHRPDYTYWFGTDNMGRDFWCQVWYATHISIRLALIVAAGQ